MCIRDRCLHPKIVYPPKTVTCLRNNQAVSWRDSNQRQEGRKSNILTTTPPSHLNTSVVDFHRRCLLQLYCSILIIVISYQLIRFSYNVIVLLMLKVQWYSNRVLDSYHRGCGFDTHPGPIASNLEQSLPSVLSPSCTRPVADGWPLMLSLIHIWRCRRIERCRSRWSPYH